MVIAMKNACGFVDESIRGQQYLMACAVIQARHFSSMRTYLTSTTHGSSLHFNREPNYRRRAVLADLRRLPFECFITHTQIGQGSPNYVARSKSLRSIVVELQERRVPQLVIESRSNDKEDVRLIISVRESSVPLFFEFRIRKREPLLWIPDAVLWAYGAGGDWRDTAMPLVSKVIDVA
jgi:hypothetical protein